MTDEDSRAKLRADIGRAYDEIQQRNGKPRRAPLKPSRQEISRIQDRERFIALCKREWAEEDRWKRDAAEAAAHGYAAKTKPPRSLVKEWVAEYKTTGLDATTGNAAPLSFPIIYVSHVAALAQAQGEGDLDLREETVRGLLGGKSFDEAVMDSDSVKSLWQSKAGRRPRPSTLMKIIIEIVAKNPEITSEGLWDKLEQAQCPGTTIYEVDDGAIFWKNAKGKDKETRRQAIKDLLHRARKALKALPSR